MSDFTVLPPGDESGGPLGDKDQRTYLPRLVATMWRYREERFGGRDELFDRNRPSATRPPVFRRAHAGHNVIVSPRAADSTNAAVVQAIPPEARHRWFSSMKSSQALAQSVFANLAFHGQLALLADLPGEDGEPAFGKDAPDAVRLENPVTHLGEPAPTSVDVLLEGAEPVAVECKLTEWEVGSCSRPLTEDDDPRHCDGSYRRQGGRSSRCQLSEIGVRYWEYVPELFQWPADRDLQPCPVRFTFQLVRNILAVCVRPDGTVNREAHALMVYDARNPAFGDKGAAMRAWRETSEALRNPAHLRRLTWQRLLARISESSEMRWLSDEIAAKYGLASGSGA